MFLVLLASTHTSYIIAFTFSATEDSGKLIHEIYSIFVSVAEINALYLYMLNSRKVIGV